MRPDLRRPQSRHLSVSTLAWWLVGIAVITTADAFGLRWTGVLLVVAAYVIAYVWRRLRPHANGRREAPIPP